MPVAAAFQRRLKAPVVAAPMFLVSGTDLVVETCKAGIIGTFPALNQRTSEGYDAWLTDIERRLTPDAAPYGVNLVVHRSNPRLDADLALTVKHRVPLVITSLGAAAEVVKAVHGYGGVVFHDVINMRHAEKAAAAGVDGLIAVCAGAGGHAGMLSPFAFIPELRRMFAGTILLGGVMSSGRGVAAARMLGADLAYLGTRFIATRESLAVQAYKDMIVGSSAADVEYTPSVSGIHGNFLRASLPPKSDGQGNGKEFDFGTRETKAWRDVWSAGQGVGTIDGVLPTADLCARLIAEYRDAVRGAAALEST